MEPQKIEIKVNCYYYGCGREFEIQRSIYDRINKAKIIAKGDLKLQRKLIGINGEHEGEHEGFYINPYDGAYYCSYDCFGEDLSL